MGKKMVCHKCGARIILIETAHGIQVPCDAGRMYFAEEKGGKEIFLSSNGREWHGRAVAKPEDARGYAHRVHWQSCAGKTSQKPEKTAFEKAEKLFYQGAKKRL